MVGKGLKPTSSFPATFYGALSGEGWLRAFPIDDYGFILAFRDALSLRHDWSFQNMLCPVKQEGYLQWDAMKWEKVRDVTASLLTEVCYIPYNGTPYHTLAVILWWNHHVTPLSEYWMHGFWGRFEKALRVFNPSAQSNQHGSLASVNRRHEQEKRQYEQRVQQIKHATFTQLVMSTTGRMGKAATMLTFYKRLASILSEKRDVSYRKTMNWIRCAWVLFC